MDELNFVLTDYNVPIIEQRADPFICRLGDGSYYFTASVPEYDRIVLRHANSIEELKKAKEVTLWEKHESGPQSIHIWAPEIHFIEGKWFIYYAAGDKDDVWAIRPYVLACGGNDPMTDQWVEMGKMQAADGDDFSFHSFSLDATVFQNNGDYFYVWAEKTGVGQQISNLYIAKMAAANKLATPQVLLTTPDYDWERVDLWVNEAPAILKHDGRIFLTFSASSTGADYCLGLMYAEEDSNLLDPRSWTKLPKPVLQTDSVKGIYGPGHNSFVKSADAQTDLCIYHARQYDQIIDNPLYDPNRHMMIMKVTFNRAGFPEFHFQKSQELSPYLSGRAS